METFLSCPLPHIPCSFQPNANTWPVAEEGGEWGGGREGGREGGLGLEVKFVTVNCAFAYLIELNCAPSRKQSRENVR